MAVVTLYTSDLDPEKRMFKSKKEADEHDKKLELAEGVAAFISQQITTIDEDLAETLGMLIAENKERIMLALKGKPQALYTEVSSENSEKVDDDSKTKGKAVTGKEEKIVALK